MKLKSLLLFIAIIASQTFTKAQSKYECNANIGIVAGYSGFKQDMFEVGIGFQPWEVECTDDYNFVRYPFAGFLALYEFSPNQKLYGTSFNYWYLSGLFAFGLNFNRYSDYENQAYGFKPMVGISSYRVGLMYGYNFYLTKSIEGMNHSSLTLKYYLPLLRKKK